jgi:hypothetical protein
MSGSKNCQGFAEYQSVDPSVHFNSGKNDPPKTNKVVNQDPLAFQEHRRTLDVLFG